MTRRDQMTENDQKALAESDSRLREMNGGLTHAEQARFREYLERKRKRQSTWEPAWQSWMR